MDGKKVIVSLDSMTREQALIVAWTLSTRVWGFKINDLILTHGTEIIRTFKCLGNVFADVKLHSDTIANSVGKLADAGADMISIHPLGGKSVMEAALDQAGQAKIIGVTLSPNIDESTCEQIYGRGTSETIWDLAHLSVEAGLHGILCGGKELNMLKHLKTIKIREEGDTGEELADFVIVGKAISSAIDPVAALERI